MRLLQILLHKKIKTKNLFIMSIYKNFVANFIIYNFSIFQNTHNPKLMCKRI